MRPFNDSYFAELEEELGSLSAEERDSILRELQAHREDAEADPDTMVLRLGVPSRAVQVGRSLRRIHAAAKREAYKRRSMLAIGTALAVTVIISSFIFPWFDRNVVAFVIGGISVVCAIVSLIGIWMPRRRLGRWLVWSGSAGLTLVGLPSVISFSSFYLIFGPLLLWTGTRLQRA